MKMHLYWLPVVFLLSFTGNAQTVDYSKLSLVELADVINKDTDRQEIGRAINELSELWYTVLDADIIELSESTIETLMQIEYEADAIEILDQHRFPNAILWGAVYYRLAKASRAFDRKFRTLIDSFSEEKQVELNKLTASSVLLH